ncbi:MAG: M3 family oligoendopeptidase [Chloroflexota bacterium]
MTSHDEQLPHWDLTVIYDDIESEAFAAGFEAAIADIKALVDLFDSHKIDRLDEPAPVTAAITNTFETVVNRINEVGEQAQTLSAYINGHLAVDSRNDVAQARHSELQRPLSQLGLLGTRLVAWLGSLDVEALIEQSDLAYHHAFALRRAQTEAAHQMSPAEESLASELRLTGRSAWFRMFSDTASQLKTTVEMDGERQTIPLTAAFNLMHHSDRSLRRQTHEAIWETLESATVPLAAALNSIKGETLTLCDRRGWQEPLDMVLFQNAIDRPTLDAMMEATRAAFPDFQRYLKARAQAMGLPVLAQYDRLAPLGEGGKSWSYGEAVEFVLDQFGTYSDKMQQLAQRAFTENWIDAEPRDGKRGGAFCMWLQAGESRILSNFQPSFTAVSTLAHELGHAYHNLNLAQRTPLQRNLPMTLAETASTFCQKIVENAALKTAEPQDQLRILDGGLEYATRVILGASSDFMFEQQLFERRRQRALSAAELTHLSAAAQREVFGDAVDPETVQKYRWVYVPHYYTTSYYNFPYIFGLLFGLGLYAYYQANPDSFKAGYDDLLSRTGMEQAAELAADFGIDLRQPAFWEASLDVLRADIERFVSLTK